jgi:thiol:disulfide interchange protein
MTFMRSWPAWLIGIVLALATLSAQAANTTVELILSHDVARQGERIWAGIHLKMASGWHTYWKNPGESGGATEIEWSLPAGVTAGEILWPVPEKYVAAGLTTYVYHNETVLLVPLSIATNVSAGTVELKAKVSWLECAELCVRGKTSVVAKLAIGSSSKPSDAAAMIDAWQKNLPQSEPDDYAKAWWEETGGGDTRSLVIEWTPKTEAKEGDFYPFASDRFTVKPATKKVSAAGKAHLKKEVEKLEGAWPNQIPGLLVELRDGDKTSATHEVKLWVGNSPTKTGSETGAASAVYAEEKKPLIIWLAFAFVGGLILNLMPCVLPVIALKIFGFVNQSQESPARVRKLGIIYALGVLASFLVLAGLVISVQSAGKLASWGMQFGNPYFLVGMTVLVTLVALNFFGLFEVTLGGGAMGAASELASREGASGAFFNGVLATALATPCTAPFLASALGFAFAQPPAIIVLIFAAVALGLAAPYVILSFQPAWLKFLPKPGAWMEKFKIAMGFPMLATAVWLLSLASRHYGTNGILWIGMFLVFVAIAAWIWGQFVQRGSKHRGLALALSLIFLIGGYAFALESQLDWRTRLIRMPTGLHLEPGGIQWQPWSRAAVERARAEGRPVFVDFTADWCVTCQANKRTSIEIPSVRQKLKEINAVALLGDYTLVPDDITEELKRFQRAGVPLVLVYSRDALKPPEVLPALLTPSTVLEALDRAAK